MSIPPKENQQDTKQNDKELNFRAIEAQYKKQLESEVARRSELEKNIAELQAKKSPSRDDEEDDDDEPYVDRRKLDKKLAKFGEQTKQQTQTEIQKAVHQALAEERQRNWLKSNPDFYEVMGHAEKFADMDAELAETILSMPDGFDRQKLVYKSIKALGLHKPPEEKKSSIQDKVDANRRSPYYQPSGVGSAPYNNAGDFSKGGQKNAYDKMQELKNRLRLG